MKLSLIIFLSLLIFTGTAKNHTSTEDSFKVLVTVSHEEKEEEEASNEITLPRPVLHEIYVDKGTSEPLPEDSGGDNEDLKLHNSLKSLQEYLEMLKRNKKPEEPISKEESVEGNDLGPHYHTMYTNEPPMEILPEEIQEQEKVGDNPPKDLYFQPIPISDKIGMAQRNVQVGTGGGQQVRETVLLAVSSATLAVLLLLTVFCAAAVYHCSKPHRYSDDFSLTSSEKRALCYPTDSSYTRTEDSSLLWNEQILTEQSGPGMKYAGVQSFSAYIDEISTFSDESARTAERDKTEAAQRGLSPYQAAAPSVPPPAEAVPPPAQEAPPAPVPAEGALPAPVPAEGALPSAAGPPPPPPVPPPAEAAPPQPPPAEAAPPQPPPAEGAPPQPPPAEGAPPPAEGAPPPPPPPAV